MEAIVEEKLVTVALVKKPRSEVSEPMIPVLARMAVVEARPET